MDALAERLARRLQADPNDAQAYEALRTRYREIGDLASLANLIEGWAAYQTDPVRRAEGYYEASQVVADPTHPRRRELLHKALQADPCHHEALREQLERLEADADPHGLAEFLDQHLRAMETQPGDRALMASLYARLGALWRTTFERSDVARKCYERALELDGDTAIAEQARSLARELQDKAFEAQVCGLSAAAQRDPARKQQGYVQQAELCLAEPVDLDGAVQALRAALEATPSDVTVMHRLASCLNRRAATKTGAEAAKDLRRVADLYYSIAQAVAPEDAADYLEAALTAAPAHTPALEMLERLSERLGRPERLPNFWLGYLANAPEGPELDARRVSMARAYAAVEQLDDAIYCLEQVRTEGVGVDLLRELREQRGPGGGAQPRAEGAPTGADAGGERPHYPTAKPPVRARTKSAERPLDVAPVLTELRRQVRDAIAAHDTGQAVSRCREILDLEPADAEAFALLESHYRKTRDYAQLRDLLLSSTQISGVSVDVRKQRLREVAAVCEAKLKDVERAIEVWRSVVALDPADVDASKSLKRLLQRTSRWDELAAVLDREALAAQDPQDKAALLAQIAAIHRDKRNDPYEAAEALRQLYGLRRDAATRDELCDLLLTIESYADAVELLRERVETASGEREQLQLLRLLAQTLDDKLSDSERAHAVCMRIVALRPKDSEALERMQRIDERTGNTRRLLDTLERRAAMALRAERVPLLLHMAELADRDLDDIDRAAAYYANALELDPLREGLLEALCELFERRQRFDDLVALLARASAAEREPSRRIALLLRRAQVLRERGDDSAAVAAAEVYREVLALEENAEALEFLLERARHDHDSAAFVALSARLSPLLGDPSAQRALLFERAQVLVAELGRTHEGVQTLRDIVERVDPDYEPAIDWLAELSGNLGDSAGLACALSRRLRRSDSADTQVALAKRLADLYEQELSDPAQAIAALQAWAKADAQDATPERRLRPLLLAAGRFDELVLTCDALAELETQPEAREQATLEAAHHAFTHANDFDGAFRRLAPLVEAGSEEALERLSAMARKAGRADALAALCVRGAQSARRPKLSAELWAAAVRVYAEDLGNPAQALEAALRLLATDLHSRQYLTLVEDRAAEAQGFGRLNAVYDRLIKAAANDTERVELYLRHADLLETRAHAPSEALDRVLRACALAPRQQALFTRALRLAKQADRCEELLGMCEREAIERPDADAKQEWLLRGASFAVSGLDDRERASAYLMAALAVSQGRPQAWEQVVAAAVALDAASETGEPHAMLRELVRSHRKLSDKTPAPAGVALVKRAHRLLIDRLDDPRGAFQVLREGSTRFPLADDLYEALLSQAESLGRLDALDAHLGHAVDEAIDPKTAATLLARRARLLEGPLGRPQEAADVYAKLLQLRPDDARAANKLRDSLRRAQRFQDLLLVIHKQIQRTKHAQDKLELLRESAQVWELDLKNRWEAVDAWRKVLELAPGDVQAQRALARLERRSGAPPSGELTAAGAPPQPPLQDETLGLAHGNDAPSPDELAARDGSSTHQAPAAEQSEERAPKARSAPDDPGLADGAALAEDLPSAEVTPLDDPITLVDEDIEVTARPALPPRRSTPPPPPTHPRVTKPSGSLPPPVPGRRKAAEATEAAHASSIPPPIPRKP